ncbi:retron Ec78 anti-phage system effector HNH endonuclease PtuB [Snodgrassella communis]|uniref:retron Ec78 anti-phage system effector HNH endonuclease PtuB n=1 Tax=Snodgrassella communis TaxID=2946699 RepID=UPI00286A409F|nr:retron Ec78 anti-phage system effector HNH endonuclease PtuB [Snodgrassella communis]WMY92512.1 TIGR02646 family protein [Snodgrassella communis]
MRYIKRTAQMSCLNDARQNYSNWKEFKKENPSAYDSIIAQLINMQNGLCAYCECKLKKDYHVEHFRCRDQFPQNEFDWNNLFASCNNSDHCGRYKDDAKTDKYHIEDLLKPDIEADNPRKYFTNIPQGLIKINSNLTDREKDRALETLKVLNLNEKNLANRRKKSFATYLSCLQIIEKEKDFQRIIDMLEGTKYDDGFYSILESMLTPSNE